jgi:two-component system, NarL family, response regulator YdfI
VGEVDDSSGSRLAGVDGDMKRIVICGSNSIVIEGLATILDREPQLKVVGSFLNGDSLSSIKDCQADLLLLEPTLLPDWQLEQWLSTIDIKIAGILLADSLVIEAINEYLALGFLGFLPHFLDAEQIITAIDAVVAGLIVIHPDLVFQAQNAPAIAIFPQSEIYLTSREIEILQLLGAGLDNKAIASKLQISKHTVKFHLSSIFSKLDVSSRTEAVTFGLRQGLIQL